MNGYLVFVYFSCFAVIAGAAFAMMWANIMSIDMKPKPVRQKHPEAPKEGEEVMYVDFSRDCLLYTSPSPRD